MRKRFAHGFTLVLLAIAPAGAGVLLTSAPVLAADCYNTGCDYKDPSLHGCGTWTIKASAVIHDQSGNNAGAMWLLYSVACGAASAQFTFYGDCNCAPYDHEWWLIAYDYGQGRAQTGWHSAYGGSYQTWMLGDATWHQTAQACAKWTTQMPLECTTLY